MITIQPRITHTIWTLSTGYAYVYGMAGAHWVPERMASDVPTPAHLADAIAAEEAKHQPKQLRAGDQQLTLYPRLETFRMEILPGGKRHLAIVHWYDNQACQGAPVYVDAYYPDNHHDLDPAFHEAHDEHIAWLESQIEPHFRASHNGEAHDPGDGPIKQQQQRGPA